MDYTIENIKKENNLGLFSPNGRNVLVSSRTVSKYFEKEHGDVLEKIKKVAEDLENSSTEKSVQYFMSSKYKDASGKSNKEYLLARDGFVLLVMGFTGEKALLFKIDYIKAFNRMYDLINTRQLARDEYRPMTDALKEYNDRHNILPNPFTYSNEADMINRIVLGMSSKQCRTKLGLTEDMETRNSIPEKQLKIIEGLQIANTDMLYMDLIYDERKNKLISLYNNKYKNEGE